jgi:serine phosphatase RsbU (regulator of sigma subunit)
MKTEEVEWAGANNPLYKVTEDVLSEIKGDKQPIGYSDNVVPYTNHKVSLQKGDSLYLFSDGFADQFGGEKGKKYKYANFKKIITHTNSMPVDNQKNALLKSLRDWQGDLEQLDDICVIGVRF